MITVLEPGLVVLIGPSGSGKSTFARQHFRPTEVVSSDACRAMISDDENNQVVTEEAFELLHFIVRKRLARRRLTVVDATNVQPRARAPLLEIARECGRPAVAIVFNLPKEICRERSRHRTDRALGPEIVHNHWVQLQRSLAGLREEGFDEVFLLRTEDDVNHATVTRARP